jgi:hypothetical protein
MHGRSLFLFPQCLVDDIEGYAADIAVRFCRRFVCADACHVDFLGTFCGN